MSLRHFFCFLFIICTINLIKAQSRLDSVQVLQEVVVQKTTSKYSVVSPMPVQTLSGKDLGKLNSLSVADAIRYFSGVQLKDYGGIGGLKTVNVRSLGSEHTAVFYDGMSVGNAQNGQVDLGRFSLDNIEEIQLYNGQKSSIFQPARGFFASNSLYLKSKVPSFEDNKKDNLKINFKTGSFGLVDPSILYQHKLSNSLSLSFSSEYMYADGKYRFRYKKDNGYDITATRQNGDVNALRAEIGVYKKLKTKGDISVKAYLYNSRRGLPGAIVANRFNHSQRQWDRNIFLHANYHQSITDRYELMVNVKYSDDYNRYRDPEYHTLDGVLDNKYYQKEYYLSAVNQYNITPYWAVSLSIDFVVNKLNANLYRFPYPTRYSYFGVLSTHFYKPRFDLQLNLLACYINETVKYYQKGDSRNELRPVISASFQPFNIKSFRLRAFYKQSFRMPTFNDLYYTFVGNSNLKPEYNIQYDLGFTWISNSWGLLSSLSIQGDAYYNRIRDKIIAMPSSNLFRWTMMNLGKVEIKGLELGVNAQIDLPYNIKANIGGNYTYQRAIDITPKGSTYGDQIPYVPKNSATATASLQWKGWQMNYSYIYTGSRYSQKANILVNYVQPWYTSDIALHWDGVALKKKIRLGAEINNLFNQYYDVILNFPMPGRSYMFSLSLII